MVAPQEMQAFSNPKGNVFNDFEKDTVEDSTSLSPVTASLTFPTQPWAARWEIEDKFWGSLKAKS